MILFLQIDNKNCIKINEIKCSYKIEALENGSRKYFDLNTAIYGMSGIFEIVSIKRSLKRIFNLFLRNVNKL
jgi:hypothetical protein